MFGDIRFAQAIKTGIIAQPFGARLKIIQMNPNQQTVFERKRFPLLLLPDEICLVDDDDVYFELHCEPTGFNFLGCRDVDVEFRCQAYLTNNRVEHP